MLEQLCLIRLECIFDVIIARTTIKRSYLPRQHRWLNFLDHSEMDFKLTFFKSFRMGGGIVLLYNLGTELKIHFIFGITLLITKRN